MCLVLCSWFLLLRGSVHAKIVSVNRLGSGGTHEINPQQTSSLKQHQAFACMHHRPVNPAASDSQSCQLRLALTLMIAATLALTLMTAATSSHAVTIITSCYSKFYLSSPCSTRTACFKRIAMSPELQSNLSTYF